MSSIWTNERLSSGTDLNLLRSGLRLSLYLQQPTNSKIEYIRNLKIYLQINQSVQNAGVAFVKGANERNKFFEKINKQ